MAFINGIGIVFELVFVRGSIAVNAAHLIQWKNRRNEPKTERDSRDLLLSTRVIHIIRSVVYIFLAD